MAISDRIKKLLALSESPNEAEATEALLKARELMAKYKIEEASLVDSDAKSKTVKKGLTGIVYSPEKNMWRLELAAVISEAYCCRCYRNRAKHKKTSTIGFIGLTSDWEMCVDAYYAAVRFVDYRAEEIRASLRSRYNWHAVEKYVNNYSMSFCKGLEIAFASQNTEGWALAVVIPEEVEEVTSKLNKLTNIVIRFAEDDMISTKLDESGYKDGLNYKHQQALQAG